MTNQELAERLREDYEWPVEVKMWEVEQGENSVGHDAVWVWVIYDDPLADDDLRNHMRQLVRERAAEVAQPVPDVVYVRFRDTTEHLELQDLEEV